MVAKSKGNGTENKDVVATTRAVDKTQKKNLFEYVSQNVFKVPPRTKTPHLEKHSAAEKQGGLKKVAEFFDRNLPDMEFDRRAPRNQKPEPDGIPYGPGSQLDEATANRLEKSLKEAQNKAKAGADLFVSQNPYRITYEKLSADDITISPKNPYYMNLMVTKGREWEVNKGEIAGAVVVQKVMALQAKVAKEVSNDHDNIPAKLGGVITNFANGYEKAVMDKEWGAIQRAAALSDISDEVYGELCAMRTAFAKYPNIDLERKDGYLVSLQVNAEPKKPNDALHPRNINNIQNTVIAALNNRAERESFELRGAGLQKAELDEKLTELGKRYTDRTDKVKIMFAELKTYMNKASADPSTVDANVKLYDAKLGELTTVLSGPEGFGTPKAYTRVLEAVPPYEAPEIRQTTAAIKTGSQVKADIKRADLQPKPQLFIDLYKQLVTVAESPNPTVHSVSNIKLSSKSGQLLVQALDGTKEFAIPENGKEKEVFARIKELQARVKEKLDVVNMDLIKPDGLAGPKTYLMLSVMNDPENIGKSTKEKLELAADAIEKKYGKSLVELSPEQKTKVAAATGLLTDTTLANASKGAVKPHISDVSPVQAEMVRGT